MIKLLKSLKCSWNLLKLFYAIFEIFIILWNIFLNYLTFLCIRWSPYEIFKSFVNSIHVFEIFKKSFKIIETFSSVIWYLEICCPLKSRVFNPSVKQMFFMMCILLFSNEFIGTGGFKFSWWYIIRERKPSWFWRLGKNGMYWLELWTSIALLQKFRR